MENNNYLNNILMPPPNPLIRRGPRIKRKVPQKDREEKNPPENYRVPYRKDWDTPPFPTTDFPRNQRYLDYH